MFLGHQCINYFFKLPVLSEKDSVIHEKNTNDTDNDIGLKSQVQLHPFLFLGTLGGEKLSPLISSVFYKNKMCLF